MNRTRWRKWQATNVWNSFIASNELYLCIIYEDEYERDMNWATICAYSVYRCSSFFPYISSTFTYNKMFNRIDSAFFFVPSPSSLLNDEWMSIWNHIKISSFNAQNYMITWLQIYQKFVRFLMFWLLLFQSCWGMFFVFCFCFCLSGRTAGLMRLVNACTQKGDKKCTCNVWQLS